jgi:hypothetical protein
MTKQSDFFVNSELVCRSVGNITPELCCSGTVCASSERDKLKELLDAKDEPKNG